MSVAVLFSAAAAPAAKPPAICHSAVPWDVKRSLA